MKIFLRLALLVLLCFFAGCKPKLYSFSPPDKSFTVKMPGIPKEESKPANKEDHTTGTHDFSVQYGEQEYGVAYADYDFNLSERLPAKELLDMLTPLIVRGGKVETQIDAPMNGNIGREFQIIESNGKMRHAKFVVAGSRLYELDAIVNNDDKSSEMAERFLISFQLNGS